MAQQIEELSAKLEKLQRDVYNQNKQHAKYATEGSRRMEDAEKRQEEVVDRLSMLEQQVSCSESRQEALLETYRKESRESISKVVEKIAEQFDAVQLSLDDLIQDTADGMTGLKDAVSELRKSSEDVQSQVERMRQETADTLSLRIKEYQSEMQDEIARVRKNVGGFMEEMKERVSSDSEDVRNMLQGYEEMSQEMTRSLEDTMETSHKSIEDKIRLLEEQMDQKSYALQDKFATYKSYVGRLRRDVHALERKFEDSQENLVGKVSSELDVAERNMNVLAQHFATCN